MFFTSYTGRNRVNNRNAGNSARNRSVQCLDSHLVLFSIVESLLRRLFPSWDGPAAQADETR